MDQLLLRYLLPVPIKITKEIGKVIVLFKLSKELVINNKIVLQELCHVKAKRVLKSASNLDLKETIYLNLERTWLLKILMLSFSIAVLQFVTNRLIQALQFLNRRVYLPL